MKKNVLKIVDLNKTYNNKKILNDLNVNMEGNRIYCIIGKSGCGKSTFLNSLINLIKLDKGEFYLNGIDIKPYKLVKKVGFVSQENSFYENLSVSQNLWFFGKSYNFSNSTLKKIIDDFLIFFKLFEVRNSLSKDISGGQKRRLEICLSLLNTPDILILDEPFTGLDILIKDEIWNLLMKIKKLGIIIILVTHELENISKYIDNFLFMKDGKFTNEKNDCEENFDLKKEFVRRL